MVEPLIISDLGTLNNFYKKRVVAVTNYLFVCKGQLAQEVLKYYISAKT